MSSISRLRQAIAQACQDVTIAAMHEKGDEWIFDISPSALPLAVRAIIADPDWHHLSAISGEEGPQGKRLLYHFWLGMGVTLRVTLPAGLPRVPSIAAALPGADWYEREAHEMLGIIFTGRERTETLLLPDDWQGPPPLSNEALR